MQNIWLEFTFSDVGVFISDWTELMEGHARRGHREYWQLLKEFQVVSGKHITYHIKAYGKNKDEIKRLAIWYHANRADGNFRKYRLD